MDRPERALAAVAWFHALATRPRPVPDGQAVLELGAGDSLPASAAARGKGAGRVVASDVEPFARADRSKLEGLDAALRAAGPIPLPLAHADDAEAVLARIVLDHRPDWLTGLAGLPGAIFALVRSKAVLEHVRRYAVPATLAASARRLKPSGVMGHGIDVRVHPGGALDHLRISPERW